MRNRRKGRLLCFAAVTAALLSACSLPFGGQGDVQNPSEPGRVDTGFVAAGLDSYDSADTGILMGRNQKENTITILNLDLGRKYTLSVDGTTRFYDKYGESISASQLQTGDVVDVKFLKSRKHLTSLQLSVKAWSYEDVVNYTLNTVRSEVTIGEDTYKITSNTQFLSEGRSIEVMDINDSDVLSFQGIDNRILTVRVDKGHGYLRLANAEKFIGGWIEIGQTQIQRITEDMLLVVPEGAYQVNISHNGGGGTKSVEITRNQEAVLDIGDLEIPEPQTGMVLFSLNPAGTELYVDGVLTDTSAPVVLEYGLHQLIARAEGYQSITKYIRVAQESAGIDVVLDAIEEDTEESKDTSSESSSGETDTASDYYKVYIDAPEEAEAYLDGNYIGTVPCSFRKTAGTHVLILRRTGYETRSYTMEIEDEDRDLSYSFVDLVPESSEEEDTE